MLDRWALFKMCYSAYWALDGRPLVLCVRSMVLALGENDT